MLNRKLFFWLERLKISRGERRAIVTLIVLLLVLAFINMLMVPKPPFRRAEYAKIETAFKQRTAFLKEKNKKVMAPFKGVAISTIAADKVPAKSIEKPKQMININTAGIKELSTLPGIGPAYAQNIINHRNKNGLFSTKTELLQVEGIGRARFNKIKALIVLGKTDSTRAKKLQITEIKTSKAKPPATLRRINVNKATAQMLTSLPGIGPAYAQNIINYRLKHGSFTTFEELLKVKGIGKKRLEKLKPFIILNGKPE